MTFFELPDRQVIYLLDYLRTYLRENRYVRLWLDTSDEVVDGTIARRFYKEVVYKGEPRLEVARATLPYLALWRNKNSPDRSTTSMVNKVDAEFGWICEIPQDMDNHDAESVGQTLASNVWHLCWEALEEIPLATRQKAGVGSVWTGDCELIVDESEAVCGFISELTFEQTKPPFYIEDPDDLAKVVLNIKLYDSSGPTDLGLSLGADIDANA